MEIIIILKLYNVEVLSYCWNKILCTYRYCRYNIEIKELRSTINLDTINCTCIHLIRITLQICLLIKNIDNIHTTIQSGINRNSSWSSLNDYRNNRVCARSIESQGGCCKFQWSIGNDKTAWIRLTGGKEKNVCLARLHESARRSFQLDESRSDVSDLRIRSRGRAIVNWSIFEHKSEEKEEARACTRCWTITRGSTGGCLFRRGEFSFWSISF